MCSNNPLRIKNFVLYLLILCRAEVREVDIRCLWEPGMLCFLRAPGGTQEVLPERYLGADRKCSQRGWEVLSARMEDRQEVLPEMVPRGQTGSAPREDGDRQEVAPGRALRRLCRVASLSKL